MVSVQPLLERRHDLSECIVWDDVLGVLWWTDIFAATLWQYDPVRNCERSWALPSALGSFALTATPGVLLLGLRKELARFDTNHDKLDVLAPVEPDLAQTRINDGRCDRAGNFIFGTTNDGALHVPGAFYRYTPQGQLSRLDLPSVAIANSLCFSPDGGTLYYADSPARRIMACDYDSTNGQVRRSRVFAEVEHGVPDGSCVDAEGYVWNAVWGAGCVMRYAPDGRIDKILDLPARQPSCVAFGGAAFDTLYVTSAHRDMPDDEQDSGLVYSVSQLGVRGLRECRFNA